MKSLVWAGFILAGFISAAGADEGFPISKEAIQRLGIRSEAYVSGVCDLKKAQVISVLDKNEIFYLRNEKFKSVPPACSELKGGDRIVTHGANYLRVIEMDLAGGEAHDE
jgi:hypothetical protein